MTASKHSHPVRHVLAAALCAAGMCASPSFGCSDVMVPPDTIDRQVVSARTLDFPFVDETWLTNVTIQAFQRGQAWRSDYNTLGDGKQWTNKYGFVGMHALRNLTKHLGRVVNMDGLNTEGLSAAFLWLETTGYPLQKPKVQAQALGYYDTVNYILGRFATVAEVKAALTDPKHPDYVDIYSWDFLAFVPLHVVVRDASGKSLIIEWTGGAMHIYDGPDVDDVGVLTNDPPYPEQLTNLRKEQYRNATPEKGMAGIPGDTTMQGRFVRLAKLRENAKMTRSASAVDAIQVAAHLINNVDVVYGTNREPWFTGMAPDDYTGPVLIRNHRDRVLYFKGNNNQDYRKIVLGGIDFDVPHLSGILADPLPADPVYKQYTFGQDVTAMLNASATPVPGPDVQIPKDIEVSVVIPTTGLGFDTGGIYVYALTPERKAFEWSFGAWSPMSALGVLMPAYQGPMRTQTLQLPVGDLPVGTNVYAGYGRSGGEMMVQQRQQLVYVVGTPVPCFKCGD